MFKSTISPGEIESMEYISFPGKITVISSRGPELDHAIAYLSQQRMIGFDTETKPVFVPHVPQNKTALLQLSGEDEAFLFRLNKMGLPREIADIMSDRYITKIGAAVTDDIRGLCHHTFFTPGRFMDLQEFGACYGIKEKAVRKMAAIIFGKKVSKKEQCSNWEADPLTPSQQLYAATDAWICLRMYKELLITPQVEIDR